MRATFTQEQLEIAKTVRALVEGEAVTARTVLTAGEWTAPACDITLLRDFGLLGVPGESALIDLLVAVEAIGATLVPSRFPWHAAAVQLLTGTAIPADVLEGRRVLTPAGNPVPYAAAANGFVDGAIQEAAEIVPRRSLDPSVPLSSVTTKAATPASVDGQRRATLVVAAQLCGVAQGAIDLAADQARTRTQFGRVIGSFQGVAFQLADAATQRKAAWDLTLYAAWAVDNAMPEAEIQVHAAKAAAGKAAVFAAERCIQVHGGMGITMEADPHLYLRRALVLDALLGTGADHRRRVGELRISARQNA
ncbi:acyl-CoA dehydrogenase family protein [Virgisporangium ochraceum]|uniref:Acyl-CoA dehydrogenase n=1 Tax=Virgisporangium ochraceum TaxID=65505 RepID=A0A8J4A432_9ACTN|nr:acyl-CoA dehydrogenase family protein [Virgisporangium ochraceum]GIJ72995.1 acyl-CoA dehydrogenase [Virgisporangium ochraceum]